MLCFIEIFEETKETMPILKRLAGPFLTLLVFQLSLSFVIIDQYLTKLWALGLRILMKISVIHILFNTFYIDLSIFVGFHERLAVKLHS